MENLLAQIEKEAYKMAEQSFCFQACNNELLSITREEAEVIFSRVWKHVEGEGEDKKDFWGIALKIMKPSDELGDFVVDLLEPYIKKKRLGAGIKSFQDLIDYLKITPLSAAQIRQVVLEKTGVPVPLGRTKKEVIKALENTREEKPAIDPKMSQGGFFIGGHYKC